MGYRTGKTRSYSSKRKDAKVTNKNSADTFKNEPQPTQHSAAYKMTNINVDEWYELLNIRYYEHLHKSYHISWSNITDKSGTVSLETQIKVAELPRKNNVNTDNNMFNEIIQSSNLTHYTITLYHTTSTLLIQGSQRTVWVEKEFPILKAVLNHHRNHGTNNINEAYNHILEIPEEHQSTEQLPIGEPSNISTGTDTSMILENNTKENTSTIQPQTENTQPLETLANPRIMITPPAADIAFTIPKIILTPPDTVESIESYPTNTKDIQNTFPMKHTTDRMLSQNNSKITMIEMVELTPQKKPPVRMLHSAKKGKTNIPPRKPRHDTTPTVTIEMNNNLKCAFNKLDDKMAYFAKKYQEEQKEITNEITDLIKNIITPIAEENTNLQRDLQTANKRTDELNTLILDLTTKNKNKITENKILITNKIDEINSQVANTMDNHIKTTENRTNAML